MNAAVWIRLELRVFFGLLISGVLFIFLSFLRKPFNLLKSFDEELDQAPAKSEEITDRIVANEDDS
jgi:hypothetical protein